MAVTFWGTVILLYFFIYGLLNDALNPYYLESNIKEKD